MTDDGARGAARQLRAEHPTLPILLLSQHIVTGLSGGSGVHLGAFGYLLKDRVLPGSATPVRGPAGRRTAGSALDPAVVAARCSTQRPPGEAGSPSSPSGSTDVLRLMAQGLTNTGIAKRLFLSERTVEAHVRRLLAKLDIDDTEDANRRVLAVLVHHGVRAMPDE